MEVVSTEELQVAFQGQCWLEWLLWFLQAVMLACWVRFNKMFDVLVDSRTIHSVLHVLLGGSSPFMTEEWWELHPEGWSHLQLWGCFCGHGMGIEHMEHHWYHLVNLQWSSQQGSWGVGHPEWEPGTQFFLLGVMCTWLMVMSRGISGALGVHSERGHLQFLCKVNT